MEFLSFFLCFFLSSNKLEEETNEEGSEKRDGRTQEVEEGRKRGTGGKKIGMGWQKRKEKGGEEAREDRRGRTRAKRRDVTTEEEGEGTRRGTG